MTFGPAVGNVGMYVAREMLVSVPEDQRLYLIVYIDNFNIHPFNRNRVMRELRGRLMELLTRHKGNVSAVARDLGKARVQIRRWCKRFKLDPADYR